MKNSITKLDHINFTSSNFDQTVSWYKKVFHFDLVENGINQDGRKWGILRSGDTLLAFTEFPDKESNDREDHHRINHFGFQLLDTPEWLETLREQQLETFYNSPVRYPHSTSWYVKDPSEHEIEVSIWKDNQLVFPQ